MYFFFQIKAQTSDIVFFKYVFTIFRVESIRSGKNVDTGNAHSYFRIKRILE